MAPMKLEELSLNGIDEYSFLDSTVVLVRSLTRVSIPAYGFDVDMSLRLSIMMPVRDFVWGFIISPTQRSLSTTSSPRRP